MTRVNNSEACISCGRRADGIAVGTPGKLGWFCVSCGPDLARIALDMATARPRELDSLEKIAVEKVAEQAGSGDITIPAAELPAFISWAVKEFADTLRKLLEDGAAPF